MAVEKHPPSKSADTSSPGGNGDFDLWLQDELKKLYDPTLEEPVPDHLINLLNTVVKPDANEG